MLTAHLELKVGIANENQLKLNRQPAEYFYLQK